MKWSRPLIVLLVAASLAATPAEATTRRALLVGIDDYGGTKAPRPDAPRTWSDLDGGVADARAVEAVLMSQFGFREEDLTLLANGQATRARILEELDRLTSGRGEGDVVFFYYAGHGSRARNSRSPERDQLDETLVPADSRDGALDITDKELGTLLERAALRGAKVTAVLDSCHSGSATRGASTVKLRQIAPDLRTDRADARSPRLTEAGGLTLSAAQDYQPAAESRDEKGRAHGAFTASLLRVLAAQSPSASAEALFVAIREDLRTRGFVQEPVLEAPASRRRLPLLGEKARGGSSRALAAVAKVDAGKREVTLRTGTVTGVGPGSVFGKAGAPEGARPRLVVKSADFAWSIAVPELATDSLDGVDATTPLELLMVSPPRTAALRVSVPADAPPSSEVLSVAKAMAPLRNDPALVWVDDPGATVPTHTILYDRGGWSLLGPDGTLASLGRKPTAATVRAAALAARSFGIPRAAPCDAKPCLALRLPPSRELAKALGFGTRPEDAIQRVDGDASAQYAVYGRPGGPGAEYALVRLVRPPDRCHASSGAEIVIEPGVRDPRERCVAAGGRWVTENAPEPDTLPARTDFFALGGDPRATARQLERVATQIARVSALLELHVRSESDLWPYRLGIRRAGTTTLIEGPVKAGRHELVLQATGSVAQAARRRVYVLVLQSDGAISLLYPVSNVENVFPPVGESPADRYVLNVPIDVGPPYGVDTLLLISSKDVVPGLEALEASAVLSEPPEAVSTRGGATRGGPGSSALADLLVDTAARTRGAVRAPVAEWGVQRRRFVTTE